MFDDRTIRQNFEEEFGGALNFKWDDANDKYEDPHTYAMYLGWKQAFKKFGLKISNKVHAFFGV